MSCTSSYGFLAPCHNLEKTKDAIPRKHLDRRKDGQKDRQKTGRNVRQTLFHRTLPAKARGPKSSIIDARLGSKYAYDHDLNHN